MKDVVFAVIGFSLATVVLSCSVLIVSYVVRDAVNMWRKK